MFSKCSPKTIRAQVPRNVKKVKNHGKNGDSQPSRNVKNTVKVGSTPLASTSKIKEFRECSPFDPQRLKTKPPLRRGFWRLGSWLCTPPPSFRPPWLYGRSRREHSDRR